MPRSSAPAPDAEKLDQVRLSLIIPCWKDSGAALATARTWAAHPLVHEVIIAGVAGCSPSLVAEEPFRICCAPRPGRGSQLNLGAQHATGDVLLFHHVDSHLTEFHLQSLSALMRDPTMLGGAFYRKFDERHPILRWAEPIERWHSRMFGALYGDQSIFVRREHFLRMKGFAPIPLMEDVEFSRRLRRSGRIALLDPPMASSPERQLAQGAWRTTARNLLFLLLYQFGVSPITLHFYYYRDRLEGALNQPVIVDPAECDSAAWPDFS